LGAHLCCVALHGGGSDTGVLPVVVSTSQASRSAKASERVKNSPSTVIACQKRSHEDTKSRRRPFLFRVFVPWWLHWVTSAMVETRVLAVFPPRSSAARHCLVVLGGGWMVNRS